MPGIVMKAPIFKAVLGSRVVHETQSVAATFAGVDGKSYEVEFSANCAPLAIAALAAELGKLVSILPEDKRPEMQSIVCKALQTAMRDDGALTLMLTLESGAELPLVFQREDLASIAAQFSDLAKLADPRSHH